MVTKLTFFSLTAFFDIKVIFVFVQISSTKHQIYSLVDGIEKVWKTQQRVQFIIK